MYIEYTGIHCMNYGIKVNFIQKDVDRFCIDWKNIKHNT